jgi:hypothetical protein
MPGFISDNDMSKLETSHASGKVLTDDQMAQMETASSAPASSASESLPARMLKDAVVPGALLQDIYGSDLVQGGIRPTLGRGFQDEGTAALDSVVESIREKLTGSTSLAPGESLSKKYETAQKLEKQKQTTAEQRSPGISMAGKLIGEVPQALATGGASLGTQALLAGGASALQTLGESDDKTSQKSLTQAAKDGALSFGLTGALGLGLKLIQKGANYFIKGPKASFQLGREMKDALTNPATQEAVGNEIIDASDNLEKLVFQSKDQVGQGLKQAAAANAGKVVDVTEPITTAMKALDSFDPKASDAAIRAKGSLKSTIETYLEELSQAGGEADQIPFEQAHAIKQELGKIIYDQGEFAGDKYVNKLAKNLYRDVSKSLVEVDKGGQYTQLNKVYTALASAEPDTLKSSIISGLSDPTNLSARERYFKVLGGLKSMDPQLKAQYIPELANYLDNDFDKLVTKAEILRTVSGKNRPLILKGLPIPSPSGLANEAGAYVGSSPIADSLTSAAEEAAPAASSLLDTAPRVLGTELPHLGRRR